MLKKIANCMLVLIPKISIILTSNNQLTDEDREILGGILNVLQSINKNIQVTRRAHED